MLSKSNYEITINCFKFRYKHISVIVIALTNCSNLDCINLLEPVTNGALRKKPILDLILSFCIFHFSQYIVDLCLDFLHCLVLNIIKFIETKIF